MIVVLVATTKKRIGSMMMWTLPHWITDVLDVFLFVEYEVLLVPSKSSSSSRNTKHHDNDSSPFVSRMPSPW